MRMSYTPNACQSTVKGGLDLHKTSVSDWGGEGKHKNWLKL